MQLKTLEKTINTLVEASFHKQMHRGARLRRSANDPNYEVVQLVNQLTSDNFHIRWHAEKRLSEMGGFALQAMLEALVDPKKVGDPRLRNGVYHVLRHHKDPEVRQVTAHLLEDLHGSAADVKTMVEAHHLLQEMKE